MGSNLAISASNGTHAAVRVRAELDLETVDELWAFLARRHVEGPIVIDASGIDFIDSTGLKLLLKWAARGGDGTLGLGLRNPSRAVDGCSRSPCPGACRDWRWTFPAPGQVLPTTSRTCCVRASNCALRLSPNRLVRRGRARTPGGRGHSCSREIEIGRSAA